MARSNVVPLRPRAEGDGIEAVVATCRLKRLQAMHDLAALLRGLGTFANGNARNAESDAASGPRDRAMVAELESMLAWLSAIEIRADGGAAGLTEAAERLQEVHAALMTIIARSGSAGAMR